MKSFIILLTTLISFQQAFADSIVGDAIKENLQKIRDAEIKCLGINDTQAGMDACVGESRNKYVEELSNISSAFLGAYPEYVLVLADSEKKWSEYVKSTCKFKNAYIDDSASMKSLSLTSCESDMVANRVLDMISIYEDYLSQQ